MPKYVNSIVPGQDRAIGKSNQSSWADARDATAGSVASETGDPIIVRVSKNGSKYNLARMFIAFDTSQIKETPTHAVLDLSIAGLLNSGLSLRVVKVAANATGDSDTAFAAADFDALQGFSSGATMDGNVTAYSSAAAAESLTAGQHRLVQLNAAARRDMADLDEFKMAIVGVRDYTNTAPTADKRVQIDSVDDSTAANRPRLRWEPAHSSRKIRRTRGARGKGFSRKHVTVTTGGKTVGNGFEDI